MHSNFLFLGLYNDNLERQRDFSKDTVTLLNSFLSHLEQPVCLIAHNGNGYDFPLLQAELERIKQHLIGDILCVDSLEVFRVLDGIEPRPDYSSLSNNSNLPTPLKQSYVTPEKSSAAAPPSLKRKSPEPDIQFTPKKEKVNELKKSTNGVKRTLMFDENAKIGPANCKVKDVIVKDPEPAVKTNGDSFKKDMLDEFDFSEIEDHEYLAAVDFAEQTISKTVHSERVTQCSSSISKHIDRMTLAEPSSNLNPYTNKNNGDYVMAGSGYSVRPKKKEGQCELLSDTHSKEVSGVTVKVEGSTVSVEKDTPIISSKIEGSSPVHKVINTCSFSTKSSVSPSVSSIVQPGETHVINSKTPLSIVGESSPLKSNSPTPSTSAKKKSYKLTEIYKRLHGRVPPESHRAEDDCVSLLMCAQKTKHFLDMIDKHATLFSNIQPGY